MQVFGGLRSLSAVVALSAVLAVSPALSPTPAAGADLTRPARTQPVRSPDSGPALHHDTSLPLRTLARTAGHVRPTPSVVPGPRRPYRALPRRTSSDPVVQTSQGSRARIPLRRSFEGVSNGGAIPPDPNASVGSTQIMEVTNVALAVYSKTGGTVLGQIPTNTLWKGFGGPCETAFNVDPVVRWDTLARRWIFTQFSLDHRRLCVGVSTTADATGSYHRYEFGYQEDPDYEKLAVWPDAYYVTINSGTPGLPQEACAWDRSRMLRGADASQQCYFFPATHFLLSADLDGTKQPRRGEPNLLVTLGETDDTLRYFQFHVDWRNQAATSVTGARDLRVAPYTRACERTDYAGDRCVPQANTTQKLDSLSYFPMYRLAYRNFDDHESLVFNHAVDARGAVGVRWYELRLRGGRPVVRQQSTYAPDPTYRWMGSVAQNKSGDIALGYSQSSSRSRPSIRITGRLAGDRSNRMTFRETTVRTGAGSQIGSNRWGDYTSMAIDPSDDCTFWYTNQYQPYDGAYNWHTRIASFRLSDCRRQHPRH